MKQPNIFKTMILLGTGLVIQPAFAKDSIPDDVMKVARDRKLEPLNILAAAKTYTPAKKEDEFMCFNSGGQAASVVVYGVPSMRIYKYIPTASPDASTGYMYDQNSTKVLATGDWNGQKLTWGDTHHPAFSETDGKYDGRYLFINDKANPRLFVIDLKDFETKQIVKNPIFMSAHGGAFVTPNSEYIIEGAQYAAPTDRRYVSYNQENYNKEYRGGLTFHKFDNKKGRIDTANSFTLVAPPYTQDLSDMGKGESYGWSFTNSFCSERYIGTGKDGKSPPFEAGCSQADVDFMHVVNWKKAAEVFKAGKFKKINGHAVIPIETAIKEGLMFLIPEPKSPHGADVTPDGRFIVVAGKLDTHASVFDFRKIQQLIDNKDFKEHDAYGIPILDMEKVLHAQVQLGLGPLHTQFGSEPGVAFTSLYLDSQVVKWSYLEKKVLDKISINYNIGHLVAMQGDSIEPSGRYVVALNKLAVDRFNQVGPLLPQNHQLIDTTEPKMQLLYDLPLPMGEPHYTVCIDAKKLNPLKAYPVGFDPTTMEVSKVATAKGKERVVRRGSILDVFATVSSEGFVPTSIDARQGDEVLLHITNLEQTADHSYKFVLQGYDVLGIYPAGKTSTLRFVASQAGQFDYKIDAQASVFETRDYGVLKVSAQNAFENRRVASQKARLGYFEMLAKGPASDPSDKVLLQTALHPGQTTFENFGCAACHILGSNEAAPDLVGVTSRRSKEWLKKWILKPEDFYADPDIVKLVERYGVQMPNQGLTEQEASQVVEYLDTLKTP